MVLTIKPDDTALKCSIATQTTDPLSDEREIGEAIPAQEKKVLLYAALLGSKDEAATAVKHLLAQVNNDHANLPTELVFRLHSDMGFFLTSFWFPFGSLWLPLDHY